MKLFKLKVLKVYRLILLIFQGFHYLKKKLPMDLKVFLGLLISMPKKLNIPMVFVL